jgi:multiple sugar transport system permease protein
MTTEAVMTETIGHSRGIVRTRGFGAITGRTLVWIVLAIFGILSVVPMIWLILAPSKTAKELNDNPPFSFGSFSQYGVAWHNLLSQNDGIFLSWIGNSVLYTASIVVISCVTAVLAGYALAATTLPFKRVLLIITLIAMIIPPVALVVPLFVEISAIGLYDNPLAVILTSSFYPFGVFLAYIYFSTSIPTELYEAAKVDGAGEFTTFFRIALPLSRGLFGMLAFFSFSAAWVNYFLPYVLLQSQSNFNLSVGLGFLFTSSPALNPLNGAQESLIGRPEIALASLFLAIPILIVFIASSRLLVRGVLAGAVKS